MMDQKVLKDTSCLFAIERILLRRDHSEKELRTKLRRYQYSAKSIDTGVQRAKELHWLKKPDELSQLWTESLLRKKKSPAFIKNYLRVRGLPESKVMAEDEWEAVLKAARSVAKKIRINDGYQDLNRKKSKFKMRMAARGFHPALIYRALKEMAFEDDRN